MDTQLLILIIDLLAGFYLLWKGIGRVHSIWPMIKRWKLGREAIRRPANVDYTDRHESNPDYTLSLIGFLSGAGIVFLFSRQYPLSHWLLLMIVMISLILEGLRPSREHRNLPDVITLISICCALIKQGYYAHNALRLAMVKLPTGQVKADLEEAMHRQRQGVPIAHCLKSLTHSSKYLAEFIELYEGGGSIHTGLFPHTAILHRARWEWVLEHQTYLLINKAQKYLYPLRSFILGGLFVAFWSQVPGLHRALATAWVKMFF